MRSYLFLAGLTTVSAAPSQIHLSYTGVVGELAVDFVSTSAAGYASFSSSVVGPFTTVNTTSFHFAEIGEMHQATLMTGVTAPGKAVFYKVGGGDGESALFTVFPVPARGAQEKFAVFGDFGLANDECMTDLISEAAKGTFDSVLHVGDWAYNFESAASIVGNGFMTLMQGYAATKPVMPSEGNHEACPACAGIAELPLSQGNFTQYRARMHAVTLNAGKNAGTDSNRYYSFNQGLTHFLVFTAEAYAYNSGATFIANQLDFMKKDLAAVDRKVTPWVVGLVHKDWTMQKDAYADFSPVLEAGGMDVVFVGHVHYYNRYMPYNPMTDNVDTAAVSADGATYNNPKWMVTIVAGAAGNHEDESHYVKESPSYTGAENYGYGYWIAVNATTATWNWKTVVHNAGPKDYTDALTIVQGGRGH